MGEKLTKLKELRSTLNKTQKELAEYLGISIAAYSLYERGDREPNITILKKLADFYGVSVDYLMDRECKMPDTEDSWAMRQFIYQNVYDTLIKHTTIENLTEAELEFLRLFCEVQNKMIEKHDTKEPTENSAQ